MKQNRMTEVNQEVQKTPEEIKKDIITNKIMEILKEHNAVIIPYLDYQPLGISAKIAIEFKKDVRD